MLRRPPALALALVISSACASPAAGPTAGGSGPRIVQPGAPGEAPRPFDRASLDEIEGTHYTRADVRFMQGMIHHHTQALRMTALVPDRASDEAFRRMAQRMEISQTDEIATMQSWLRDRDLDAPDVDPRSGEPLAMMPGMLSPAQMQRLRESRGVQFERYFLEYMIQHHEGAITMVRELYSTPGAGQESTINFFANEVDADQTIEIQRMQQMLAARR